MMWQHKITQQHKTIKNKDDVPTQEEIMTLPEI